MAGGGGVVVPMSDVNFDPSCLSRTILNKNRGRMADRT